MTNRYFPLKMRSFKVAFFFKCRLYFDYEQKKAAKESLAANLFGIQKLIAAC